MANIRQAFEYAATNPNSPFAQSLKQLAASGALDVEARKNGLDLSIFKPQAPAATTPETAKNQLLNNYDTQKYGVAPKVAGALGIAEFGQGIASARLNATGENNLAGDLAAQDLADSKNLQTNLYQINQQLKAKVLSPENRANLERKRANLVRVIQQQAGMPTMTNAEIDPGSTLTPKQVLGSAANVGLLVTAPAFPGGGSKLATRVTTGAATGYAADVAQHATKNEDNIFTPGVGTVVGASLPLLGAVLKPVGKKVAESVIPTSAKEAKYLQAYKAEVPFWQRVAGSAEKPTTGASTAFNKGLMGTEEMIGVQAKRVSTNLWKEVIDPALTRSQHEVDMPAFFGELRKQIVEQTPELSRQNSLLNALDALQADYQKVGNVPLKKLQTFKEGWAEFVPQKAYKGQPIEGAFKEVKDLAASNAREVIYNTLGPEVRQAYFDYGNLKGLQELGQQAMTGGKFKGGFGSFWNAVKDMTVIPVGTIGGQTVYRVGNGIELYGRPNAILVSDLFED